jgi:hypothetical protein
MELDVEIKDLLTRLHRAVDLILDQLDPVDFPNDAANWGDLTTTETRIVFTDSGGSYLEATIEEASPDGCPNLLEYIADLLAERGFPGVAVTAQW